MTEKLLLAFETGTSFLLLKLICIINANENYVLLPGFAIGRWHCYGKA